QRRARIAVLAAGVAHQFHPCPRHHTITNPPEHVVFAPHFQRLDDQPPLFMVGIEHQPFVSFS
ncbi:hypothetical protein, partial [Enterobacter intestinihominis]